MELQWMEGHLLKDFRKSQGRFEICSLANWLIISMWWLKAFLLLYSQEMHALLYSRIMTSDITNGSSYFLFQET